MVRRVGDRRGRHPRDGEPGPDRRPVRFSAFRRQWHRVRPLQHVGIAGRSPLDRGDDRHLLRRRRDIRQHAEGPSRYRTDGPSHLRRRRPGQGRRRQGAGRAPYAERAVVQSVRPSELHEFHDRVHAHAVYLLGLGHRGLGERGDEGLDAHARPGRGAVDAYFAGYLRHRHCGLAVLCRDRHEGHRARELCEFGRCHRIPWAHRSSAAPASAGS